MTRKTIANILRRFTRRYYQVRTESGELLYQSRNFGPAFLALHDCARIEPAILDLMYDSTDGPRRIQRVFPTPRTSRSAPSQS